EERAPTDGAVVPGAARAFGAAVDESGAAAAAATSGRSSASWRTRSACACSASAPVIRPASRSRSISRLRSRNTARRRSSSCGASARGRRVETSGQTTRAVATSVTIAMEIHKAIDGGRRGTAAAEKGEPSILSQRPQAPRSELYQALPERVEKRAASLELRELDV